MAANPKDVDRHYFSLDEYFALELTGHARYEYWDGDIVCMSGGSRAHIGISENIYYRLRQRLEGRPCEAFSAEQPIKTPTLPPYRYPDASAACGESKFENMRGIDVLINPVLIAEVLSPTTAAHDQEDKFAAYKVIPSFSEYLLVAQDAPRVTHYARRPGGVWERREASGLDAALALESVGCELKLGDIYEGVAFAA